MKLNVVSNLITLSRTLGAQPDLVQGGGGNISVKAGGDIYIKASGTPLKDMSKERGWVKLGDTTSTQRPSMEWPMHQALSAPWVCHTHPVYLNVFGCMLEGETHLATILRGLNYYIVPYVQPGEKLAAAIQQLTPQPNIIILRNHGLLVTGPDTQTVQQLTESIQQRCAAAVPQPFTSTASPLIATEHYYFPDAAVLSTNPTIIAANAYIEQMIMTLGGTPQPLSATAVADLRAMEAEQYRIAIQ